jgi:carboxyl-terminal processing protease
VTVSQRASVLKSIRKRVLAHHINVAGIDYTEWCSRFDDRSPALVSAGISAFEDGVRELLAELKTSHTAYYHSVPDGLAPQLTIGATLRRAHENGCEGWMFLDVYDGGPAHVAGIKRGEVLVEMDGSDCSSDVLPTFTLGRAVSLSVFNSPLVQTRKVEVTVPARQGTKLRPPIVEPQSLIYSRLADGIGLIKLPYFPGVFGMRFAGDFDHAIRELKKDGCSRLIIDLRGSIGGSLGFARVASYMCAGHEPIGHSITPRLLRTNYRREALPRVVMPRSRGELFRALTRFAVRDKAVMLLTQGLGPQPFHGRIVVLINEWTNSAAEMLASFAGERGGAVLVGQATRGNVLGASNFRVGGGYWLRLPVFGWNTPDGRSLEGVGVAPNVTEDVASEALVAGIDNQFRAAIEVAGGL